MEYPHIFSYIYNLLTISRCSVNKILERLWSDSVSEEGITGDRLYEESYGSYWNESDSSDHDVIRSRVGRSEMFRTSFFFFFVLFFIFEFVHSLHFSEWVFPEPQLISVVSLHRLFIFFARGMYLSSGPKFSSICVLFFADIFCDGLP